MTWIPSTNTCTCAVSGQTRLLNGCPVHSPAHRPMEREMEREMDAEERWYALHDGWVR